MTHKWGRMATYLKLGDSQLSLQEERPHGETPHSMRVYVPSPNRPYPWSSGARNLGPKIRGETEFVAILSKTAKIHAMTRSRGGPGHGTLRWTRASEQAGKALRSQGHQCAHVM